MSNEELEKISRILLQQKTQLQKLLEFPSTNSHLISADLMKQSLKSFKMLSFFTQKLSENLKTNTLAGTCAIRIFDCTKVQYYGMLRLIMNLEIRKNQLLIERRNAGKQLKDKVEEPKEEVGNGVFYDHQKPAFTSDGYFKATNTISNIFKLQRVKELLRENHKFLESETFRKFYKAIKKDVIEMVQEPEYFIEFVLQLGEYMLKNAQDKEIKQKFEREKTQISFDPPKKLVMKRKLNAYEKKRLKKKEKAELEQTLKYLTINPSSLCQKQMRTIENIIDEYENQTKEYERFLGNKKQPKLHHKQMKNKLSNAIQGFKYSSQVLEGMGSRLKDGGADFENQIFMDRSEVKDFQDGVTQRMHNRFTIFKSKKYLEFSQLKNQIQKHRIQISKFGSKRSKFQQETQTQERIVGQNQLDLIRNENRNLRQILEKTPAKRLVVRMVDEMMAYQRNFYQKEIRLCKDLLQGGDPKKIDVIKAFEGLKLSQHVRLVSNFSEKHQQTEKENTGNSGFANARIASLSQLLGQKTRQIELLRVKFKEISSPEQQRQLLAINEPEITPEGPVVTEQEKFLREELRKSRQIQQSLQNQLSGKGIEANNLHLLDQNQRITVTDLQQQMKDLTLENQELLNESDLFVEKISRLQAMYAKAKNRIIKLKSKHQLSQKQLSQLGQAVDVDQETESDELDNVPERVHVGIQVGMDVQKQGKLGSHDVDDRQVKRKRRNKGDMKQKKSKKKSNLKADEQGQKKLVQTKKQKFQNRISKRVQRPVIEDEATQKQLNIFIESMRELGILDVRHLKSFEEFLRYLHESVNNILDFFEKEVSSPVIQNSVVELPKPLKPKKFKKRNISVQPQRNRNKQILRNQYYTPREKKKPQRFHIRLQKRLKQKSMRGEISGIDGQLATIERFAKANDIDALILQSARHLLKLNLKKQQEIAEEIYRTFRKFHFDSQQQNKPNSSNFTDPKTNIPFKDFTHFQKYFFQFLNKHQICGDKCIHLERFYKLCGLNNQEPVKGKKELKMGKLEINKLPVI